MSKILTEEQISFFESNYGEILRIFNNNISYLHHMIKDRIDKLNEKIDETELKIFKMSVKTQALSYKIGFQ